MALPQIVQRILDLEAGFRQCVALDAVHTARIESLEESRMEGLLREAIMATETISTLNRLFKLEMGLSSGIGNIVTDFFNGTSYTGYMASDGESIITPVTIVYNGNAAPNGSELVLRMDTITV